MNSKKIIATAVMALLAGGTVAAQGHMKSYSYVEAQGGVQMTSTNAKMTKLITPTGALSFGHYFTPVVGARLHFNGPQAKSGFEGLDQYYKWNYVTSSADLLVNLTTLFTKNYANPLNVILLGGIGLNYAWDNDELKDLNLNPSIAPLAWDDNRLTHNLRAGLRLETNVTKPIGVSLELAANSLDDRFNSKTNDRDDWMFTAMVGLAYRFGYRDYKPTKVVRQVEEEVWVDVPDTIIVNEKRPIVTEEKKKIEEVIFFEIRQSDTKAAQGTEKAIKDVADLMKTSDDAVFTLTGYADKGTGNPKLNQMYAKRRADDVTKILIEEHGLDASRLTSDSKGDTVQPFEENDKNRCVIITGEGTFKVTKYEEYDVQKVTTKKVKNTVIREVVDEVYDD